jgi:stringent starvation protein B
MAREMTPNKPYLLRALYEWILDNGLTPHIIVDAKADGVTVPPQSIRDGKLVLNIAPRATRNLELGNEAVSFHARFAGASQEIWLPIQSIMAVYARESGQGMMFAQEKEAQGASQSDAEKSKPSGPHLKVIK